MGNKVNLIEEFRNRLETAIAVGGALEGVKRVKIGASEELRNHDNLPIINIRLLSGTEEPRANRRYVDTMRIEIKLLASKKPGNSNKLYDTDDSSGSIYLLETMLNILDKNTSGSLDLNFNSKANSLRSYNYDIDETNDVIVITIVAEIETVEFSAGAR